MRKSAIYIIPMSRGPSKLTSDGIAISRAQQWLESISDFCVEQNGSPLAAL